MEYQKELLRLSSAKQRLPPQAEPWQLSDMGHFSQWSWMRVEL